MNNFENEYSVEEEALIDAADLMFRNQMAIMTMLIANAVPIGSYTKLKALELIAEQLEETGAALGDEDFEKHKALREAIQATIKQVLN